MREKSLKILKEELDVAVDMASVDTIGMVSIIMAGITMAIASIGPAYR